MHHLNKSLLLQPTKLPEHILQAIPQDWQQSLNIYSPCRDLTLHSVNASSRRPWLFQSEGEAALNLCFLLAGEMRTGFHDGGTYHVNAGSAVFMLSNQHTQGWNEFVSQQNHDFRMLNIHIPKSAIESLIRVEMSLLRQQSHTIFGHSGEQQHLDALMTCVPISLSLQSRISELLTSFQQTAPHQLIGNLYCRAKILELIALFLQENICQQTISLPIPCDRKRLMQARYLLEKEYAQDWCVADLAARVGLNEKRLQTGFKALYGKSVYAFLIHTRIQAAVILLQQGVSVTDTATMVGFSHLSHFSRVFREHIGVSPKQLV
ncbi:helix-turn-helix transcriptional regulator [Lonepinella koalarum]|uniref:helix-turn-helix transcriptional regulator n=1 Tax=Lonepinella koalarum TaxID=53417 RepID=UPI003F6E36A6